MLVATRMSPARRFLKRVSKVSRTAGIAKVGLHIKAKHRLIPAATTADPRSGFPPEPSRSKRSIARMMSTNPKSKLQSAVPAVLMNELPPMKVAERIRLSSDGKKRRQNA
jgi:hypothetical protein